MVFNLAGVILDTRFRNAFFVPSFAPAIGRSTGTGKIQLLLPEEAATRTRKKEDRQKTFSVSVSDPEGRLILPRGSLRKPGDPEVKVVDPFYPRTGGSGPNRQARSMVQ